MRFAIWAAVSTEQQAAEDKVSLQVQETDCKKYGYDHGWTFTRAYLVPGQSRTRYASLYHAEKNIPPLHALLEAASRREFDLLIIYDTNRFRSLMLQVFDVLSDYNVQLLALSNPRPPVQPDEYTDEQKSAARLLISVNDIISENEIGSLRRHYRDKMPRRITDKHLHAGLGLPPYGYQKPPGRELDKNAVLVQNPEQIRILLQIKEWFLKGDSLTQIARRLNEERIPSPRGRQWWYSIVSYLLSNPYYAGLVHFGATKRQRDRRTGQVQRRRAQPVTAQGSHQPVWDLPTHQRLLDELARRGQSHPGLKTRALSRLLHCWCGAVLWAQFYPDHAYWRCSSLTVGHVYIRDQTALARLTEALQAALLHLNDLQLPSPKDDRPALQRELKALRAKRKRWMDAYEAAALDLPTLTDRIHALDERIAASLERVAQTEQDLTRRVRTRENLQALAVSVETLPRYLRAAPPAEVNTQLRNLLASVTVHKDKTLTLEWQ